jgi:hypothetical protein
MELSNIFIVTSCMQPLFGVIDHEQRYQQTLKTFDSVRNRVPDALLVFIDSSVFPIKQEKLDVIKSKVDIFLDYSQDEQAKEINSRMLKSVGENYLLLNAITHLKTKYDFTKMSGRMYKLGGRCELMENFTTNDYDNTYGKYVFKKRLQSWMDPEILKRFNTTRILETRLYSWCFSLVDEYIQVIYKNFELFNMGLDTEHSHLINVPSEKLLEYDMLNVGCVMALNGQYMHD